eukprot:2452585-Ditylum_brightwellii.AAC.1
MMWGDRTWVRYGGAGGAVTLGPSSGEMMCALLCVGYQCVGGVEGLANSGVMDEVTGLYCGSLFSITTGSLSNTTLRAYIVLCACTVMTGGGCFVVLLTCGGCISFGGFVGSGTLGGGNKMANGEASAGCWRASMRSLATAVVASAD